MFDISKFNIEIVENNTGVRELTRTYMYGEKLNFVGTETITYIYPTPTMNCQLYSVGGIDNILNIRTKSGIAA